MAKGLCNSLSITPSSNSQRLKTILQIVAQGARMVGDLDSWGNPQTHHSKLLNLTLIRSLRVTLFLHLRVSANSSQKADSTFSIFDGTPGISLTAYYLNPVASFEYNGADCKAYLHPRPPALFWILELKLSLYAMWTQQDESESSQTYTAILLAG